MNKLSVLFNGIIVLTGGALWLWLLFTISADSEGVSQNYVLLLMLNGIMALIVIVLVSWQLWQLWREYYLRKFGARLKFRLMWMFGVIAVIPGILLYSVSIQFVTRSIDSWFNVNVEQGLSAGIKLGQYFLDSSLADLANRSTVLSKKMAELGQAQRVNYLLEVSKTKIPKVDVVSLYNHKNEILHNFPSPSKTNQDTRPFMPPTPEQIKVAKQKGLSTNIYINSDDVLVLQVLTPVVQGHISDLSFLRLTAKIPKAIHKDIEAIQAGYRDYQELQLSRHSLKQIYAIALTLTVLLTLFAAFALALEMARRLVAPLSYLTESVQAVGQGDFSSRQTLKTRDELGILTESFNKMMFQLEEAKQESIKHREGLEVAHAYLESILSNLSAGVLVLDKQFVLQVFNTGAKLILNDELEALDSRPLSEWPRLQEFANCLAIHLEMQQVEWSDQFKLDQGKQILLVRGSRLPESNGGGYIVVFDDISQLIAAQKSAAWGEVAQRLAHEIKNPLTPIQLSAERLYYKLKDQLDANAVETLSRSTQTIVRQVKALKEMVNGFRDYARSVPIQFRSIELNKLVKEVLVLYEDTSISTKLADKLPAVMGDAAQLRQVIHNLLKNSKEALKNESDPKIHISTQISDQQYIELVVQDNGPGFNRETLMLAFEPDVTTKKEGSGLGLAIVKRIVDEHQGYVELSNLSENVGLNSEITGAKIRVGLKPAED